MRHMLRHLSQSRKQKVRQMSQLNLYHPKISFFALSNREVSGGHLKRKPKIPMLLFGPASTANL